MTPNTPTPRTATMTVSREDQDDCSWDTLAAFARQLERELQQATARVSDLEAQIERNAWTISPAMAQARIDQLSADLHDLQASHDLNQVASDALSELRADLARVMAERDIWHRAGEILEAEKDKEIAALRAKLTEYDKECTRLTDRVSALEMDRAALRARVAELETTVAAEKAARWAVEHTIRVLEQRNAELVAALEKITEGNVKEGSWMQIVALGALARASSAKSWDDDPLLGSIIRREYKETHATPATTEAPTYHVPLAQLLPANRGNMQAGATESLLAATPAKEEQS